MVVVSVAVPCLRGLMRCLGSAVVLTRPVTSLAGTDERREDVRLRELKIVRWRVLSALRSDRILLRRVLAIDLDSLTTLVVPSVVPLVLLREPRRRLVARLADFSAQMVRPMLRRLVPDALECLATRVLGFSATLPAPVVRLPICLLVTDDLAGALAVTAELLTTVRAGF
jgi:hypothetical protein